METLSSFSSALADCSATMLESIEMARMNQAVTLLKEVNHLLEESISVQAEARLARWLIEHPPSSASAAPMVMTLAVKTPSLLPEAFRGEPHVPGFKPAFVPTSHMCGRSRAS